MNALATAAQYQREPSDGRRARRQRVLLSGKIVFDHGSRSIDCTIRDLSTSGARIRLPAAELLPERFFLIEFRQGFAFDSVIEWRRQSEFGVKFLDAYKLDQATGPEFRAMREIWLEHVAR